MASIRDEISIKWYWVTIDGAALGWSSNTKCWMTSEDGEVFHEGRVNMWDKKQLLDIKGPYSEQEIEQAYFGYWV